RAIRAPDPRLRPLLYRPLYGLELRRAGFSSWLEPPRPAVTLMIDLEGSITADSNQLPSSWIGGIGERPTVVGLTGGDYASVDIELTPLGAYTVLGRPLVELGSECAGLEDVFGRAGRGLADRLREARDWDERFDVLERFLMRRAVSGPEPTPAVAWADRRLREAAGNLRIGDLAAELGCSRRYLTARFTAEVGLSPKAVARQLRFALVRARLERDPAAIAEIAVAAGYYDQSHLNRDFRELTGITPSEFVARLIPGGGIVGDGL
ncbi:MAG: helix-turn-helix transcriptional regulator, partial [Solirubrobacteraceae bacterium]